MKNIVPAYLQGYVDTAGSNQATEYARAQDELEKQKREEEEAKRKAGSLGARLGRGLTKGLVGAGTGALTGLIGSGFSPAGALAGAGIGAGAGFLGGVVDNGTSPNAITQMTPALGALGSAAAGRYMGGTSGVGFGPTDVANEYGMGNLTPEDLRMLRAQGLL